MKEIQGKVQEKSQSLPTTLETGTEILSDKIAIAGKFYIFLFGQYFSLVGTQIDHHDLTKKNLLLKLLKEVT